VLWIYYPRLRPVWTAGALFVALALVGSNFHFLGDVVAGAFLGASVGWMTVSLFDQYPNGWRKLRSKIGE
jgi:membrane-associated phospholipid phosphatase